MKIFFYETSSQLNGQTSMLLKYLLKKEKIEITDNPNNADYIFCSVTDIVYFQNLRQAFLKYNRKIPIVVGGDIAKIDFVKNYADYVVKGEAYQFIKDLAKKNIEDIANVTSRNKKGNTDYEINYLINPIIKAAPKVYYLYGGKGCEKKCKFCFYSHVNKYSTISEQNLILNLSALPSNGKLYLTCAYFPYPLIGEKYTKKLGMIDLKINEYIKYYFKNRSFRIGVEFFKDENMESMGKPITNDQLKLLFETSLKRNQELTCYLLAGLEKQEDMWNLIDIIPEYQKTYRPSIQLHFQYIDYNKFTPLQNYDIRLRNDFNTDLLQKELNKKNRRFRVMPIKYKSNSIYRTLIQRTKTFEESEFIYSLKNELNDQLFLLKVDKKFPHLLGNGDLRFN
jgi:hypothetical protein